MGGREAPEREILSTVLARFRDLSNYEYFNTAVQIRKEVTALVTSAAMPKSYRFVFAVPMAETARSIVHNLVTANAFYPNTEHNVVQRRHYMTLAVADCEQLLQDFQCLIDLGVVKVSRCARIAEDTERAIRLIKGARKGVKLIGQE